MRYRDYNPKTDREAFHRIMREVGWAEPGKEHLLDLSFECARALVAEVDGSPECSVSTAPGVMRYLEEDLPSVEVTSVATSRIARRLGLASRLVARALAADAADGALVARVCAFDQGYYDKVGFGPGSYEHTLAFDPATLKVEVKPRLPRRLTKDDLELIHASRLARLRGHGAVNYPQPAITQVELDWHTEKGFGLGYCDGPNGELTHHFWCDCEHAEHGPYHISWMAYQTREQFLELLGLIKSLGDQVRLVRLREPYGIQLQDLVYRPTRHGSITAGSRYENRMSAYAHWQVRILDLRGALARTHLACGDLSFNLRLTDPAERLLEGESGWRGVAGDYVVTVGPECRAKTGSDPSLPTLSASVNSFSRMWLGVRPATGLAATTDLAGPEPLLRELDRAFLLPQPLPDWDF
ncbi:MAG: GNAT family N-acetyltransferase [Armatimonadota bacterium]